MDGGFELALAATEPYSRDTAPWSPRALLGRPDLPPPNVFQRDLSEAALAREVLPEPPSLSTDDIEAARREGYAEGYKAGQADAAASGAALERQALATLADAMTSTGRAGVTVAEDTALAQSRALFQALSLTVPELLRRSGLGETDAFLTHLLPGLSREPHVSVSVPLGLAAGVAEHVRKLGPGHAARLTVSGHDELSPGEVKVSWNGGTARRTPLEVWRSILDAFEPHLSREGLKEPTHAG